MIKLVCLQTQIVWQQTQDQCVVFCLADLVTTILVNMETELLSTVKDLDLLHRRLFCVALHQIKNIYR